MSELYIYITGANGFIGKSLINYFKCIKEYNVIGISHSTNNCFIDNIIYSDYKNLKWMKGIIKKNSILIHSAAYIPRMQQNYLNEEIFNINTAIDKFIVDAFFSFVDKVIYFSSIAVYGYGYKELVNVTERSLIITSDYYSKSKLFGEKLIQKYYSNKEFILRLSSPYGIGKNNMGVLEKTVYSAKADENIEIYGNGERTQDYIYISDICKVVHEFIKYNHKAGIYNLASGNACRMSELVEVVIETFRSNSKIINIDKKEAFSVHINNKKISQELDMSFCDLRGGIHEIYNLMKSMDGGNETYCIF